jgi:hypothetical protein
VDGEGEGQGEGGVEEHQAAGVELGEDFLEGGGRQVEAEPGADGGRGGGAVAAGEVDVGQRALERVRALAAGVAAVVDLQEAGADQ